jgi:hypothetical protein
MFARKDFLLVLGSRGQGSLAGSGDKKVEKLKDA